MRLDFTTGIKVAKETLKRCLLVLLLYLHFNFPVCFARHNDAKLLCYATEQMITYERKETNIFCFECGLSCQSLIMARLQCKLNAQLLSTDKHEEQVFHKISVSKILMSYNIEIYIY